MLDLDRLISPISDGTPAGEDLRLSLSDVTLQTISDARTEILVEDDPGGEGRSANWALSLRMCEESLTGETKDLEIAAWLTEALTHNEGFEGLQAGLQLVEVLARKFWQEIHPGIDEDDGEISLPIRARPLTWIGTSKDFLRAVSGSPIIESADGKVLSWLDYKNTELVDQRAGQTDQTAYNELIESGYISGDDWTSRINALDLGTLRQKLASVRDCETALMDLRTACDELFKEDEPNFVSLAELLLEIREYLEVRAPVADRAETGVLNGTAHSEEGQTAAAVPGDAAGPIAGRADALLRLTEIADYFRRTEPHSPISHLIQRTIRWGHMSLPDLLREIVKDDDVLTKIWDTLGLSGGSDDDNRANYDDDDG